MYVPRGWATKAHFFFDLASPSQGPTGQDESTMGPSPLDAGAIGEVETLVSESLLEVGYELLLLELKRARGKWIMRVYMDHPDGVTLDDCAKASNHLSSVLDAKDPIPGPYVLEVSSPGLNRPLKRPEHFRRYLGSNVQVQTLELFSGRRHFTGILKSCEDSEQDVMLTLIVDDKEYTIGLSQVEKANLVYHFGK